MSSNKMNRDIRHDQELLGILAACASALLLANAAAVRAAPEFAEWGDPVATVPG